MNDEHPYKGAPDKDQDLSSERAVAPAPARDDERAADAPGAPPATGDARVDQAVGGLSRLSGRPVEEHVAVLEEVHGRLRDILEELAENPGSQG
jgi:hypothetical protein